MIRDMRHIISIMFFVALLAGCSVPRTVTRTEWRTDIQYRARWRTDSVYIRDSVYVREKGDTVFVDRWRTAWRDRETVRTDTVVRRDTVTDYQERTVRERYTPPFLTGSAVALWVIVAAALGYGGYKLYRRIRK